MGALSPYGKDRAVQCLFGSGHGTSFPNTVYLAASTTDPATTLTEPVGGGYTRASIPNNDTYWSTGVNGQVTTVYDTTFTVAGASWGVIGYIALMDAATGGNILASDALTTDQTVVAGDVLTIPGGALVVSV